MHVKRPNSVPGFGYIAQRLRDMARPPVDVSDPPAGVRFIYDAQVPMRDGTILRVNVFLPPGDGTYPAIACAHPYGKDAFPKRTPLGYVPSPQFRFMRQPQRVAFSAWTTWESPDPAFWCAHGYAVVNADLRGFGRSGGVGTLLSAQESQDYYDLIEWIAGQPWSNGRIGLNGVSYLALSQWGAAATRPPHLCAICPWEGFSDCYRDFARPGGVREDGFVPFWSAMVSRSGRTTYNVRQEQLARPLFDDWWAARCPALERIDVPALICASFSDQGLHSRGSFEGFRRIGSAHRWLYTHRGGKWATYYSPEALAFQRRFFDHFLKGEENGMLDVPRVRLEVRSDRDTIREVRAETAWPPASVQWRKLSLGNETVRLGAPNGTASFVWPIENDLTLAGPMTLNLAVSLEGCDDASLFAIVRKIGRDGKNVPFEGSYGFGYDVVAKGSLKLSLRRSFERFEKMAPGEIVTASIEILPSATFFSRGEALQLDVRSRWLYAHKVTPILGMQFYEASAPGTVVLHCEGANDAHLLVPDAR